MAEAKVTCVTEKATPKTPELVFWEPIADLYAVSNGLNGLADKSDGEGRYGEGNILRLIGKQVSAIAEFIDNNDWKASGGVQ